MPQSYLLSLLRLAPQQLSFYLKLVSYYLTPCHFHHLHSHRSQPQLHLYLSLSHYHVC